MASLKVLSIQLDGSEAQCDARDLADNPVTAIPSSRTLIVNGDIGGFKPRAPHLTHFKFYGYLRPTDEGLLSVLEVFRQCPMLEVVEVACGAEQYDRESFIFTAEEIISLPHLRYLVQEQYGPIDQPWLPNLIHLPQSCSVVLKKPSIAHNPEHIGPAALPFLPNTSPYLSDPASLSAPRSVNTGSPIVLCLEYYLLRCGEGQAATYVAQALDDSENVTALILSNSAVEPCLLLLEPNNREKLR